MKRLHVHVGVNDLDQSIGFYSTLFGAEPSVVKQDYAKWMLDDPRVNFAISAGMHARKGIEHLGIQAENGDEATVGIARFGPFVTQGRTYASLTPDDGWTVAELVVPVEAERGAAPPAPAAAR